LFAVSGIEETIMNVRHLLVAGLATLLLAAPAAAQVAVAPVVSGYGIGYGSPYGYAPYGYRGPFVGGYGYGYGWGGGTAAGNYLQGQAAVIQSQGQYNYFTALAAKEAADARAKELENRSARVRSYFELRRVNDISRAAERPTPATPEQLVKIASIGVPARPAQHQFDRPTGIILWPETLAGDEFAAQRAQLEKLFGERVAGNFGVGSALYQGVSRATTEMKSTLKEQIRQLDPAEYLAARKFLDSLAYEARFAPPGNVAAR
jgi:hypothetical protein